LVALVLVLTFVVLLLGVLVAGLLRSHADILKALHDLGAGVGDPISAEPETVSHRHGVGMASPVRSPVTMGPALPGERNTHSAPAVAGMTPQGDAFAVSVSGHDCLTLIAFLSSGCSTCAVFWEAFQSPDHLGLPAGIRLVVVTKGPELELPAEVRAKTHSGLQVIMSTEAWGDYEVPGAPFFVLIDGKTGQRIGEGVANHFSQIIDLVRRAQIDTEPLSVGSRSRSFASGLDGPAREAINDQALRAAGIEPGHPSLYPTSLEDVFPHGTSQPEQGRDGGQILEHERPVQPVRSVG
jgi:hypothetical protein